MKVKNGVLGRIGQTFQLFAANIVPLSLLYIIAIFIFELVFSTFFKFSVFGNINMWAENILDELYNVQTLIMIIVWIIIFLVYLIALIPVNIGTIRWVKQAYSWKEVTVKENFMYAINNFFGIFKTYWFIFAYVALVPAVVLIVWLILVLLWQLWIPFASWVGGIVSVVAIFMFMVYSIYRWIKATFAIYNAIEKEEYTKINFDESIKYTTNNWWRIAGNIILFALLMIFVGGIIWYVTSFLWIRWPQIDMSQFADPENLSAEDLRMVSDTLSQVTIGGVIAWIINAFVQSIITVLWTIFTYLLYKTMQIESGEWVEIKNVSAMKKEARDTEPERWVIEEL